jgi:hypothetical protein
MNLRVRGIVNVSPPNKHGEKDLEKAFNDGKRYGDDELELQHIDEETAFQTWLRTVYNKPKC